MKISAWWILAVVIITFGAAYIYLKFIYTPSKTITINTRPNYDVITLSLPRDHNPGVFGPKYWETFHKLTDNIPCPGCRGKAVPFMRFFHDIVNKGTGKPLFDKENFNNHIDIISKMEKA